MYSLSPYKLTLPVDDQGNASGSAHEINPIGSYESAYFDQETGYYQFTCPDAGATTPGSSMPRCELRNLTEHPVGTPNVEVMTFSVEQAVHGKNLILHQIHDGSEPWFKLVFTQGKYIRAFVRPVPGQAEVKILLDDNPVIGQKYKYTLHYDPDLLSVYLDEQLVASVPMSRTEDYYFKRGAYPSDNSGNGNSYIVRHY